MKKIPFQNQIHWIGSKVISDKRVLLRVDFNVPTIDGKVVDDSRIKASLPTIQKLLTNNNKIVIISHLGRPNGWDESLSLFPVANCLSSLLGEKVTLIKEVDFHQFGGHILDSKIQLLENIRFWKEEKENDPDFTQAVAKLGECFVNDGFSVCHRPTATVVGLAKALPSYGGIALQKELRNIDKVLVNQKSPRLAIMGGKKIADKLLTLEKLLNITDTLLIGGLMGVVFLKAKGIDMGATKTEKNDEILAKTLLEKAKKLNKKIILPVDFVDQWGKENLITNCYKDQEMLDIGSQTILIWGQLIKKAKTIIWNGPLGKAEDQKFARGTNKIAHLIYENNSSQILVGGGDTASLMPQFPHKENFHVSLGGGAMLEYIASESLPGLQVLCR